MNLKVLGSAATLSFSVAVAGLAFAQGPPAAPSGQPSGLSTMAGQTVTVTGCVAQEGSVSGQTPNVTERAGVAPDFILTNVQMRSASPTAGATAAPGEKPPTTPPAAAAGSAPGTSVKLKEIDNDQMRANLNKQIEVTGRVEIPRASGTAPGNPVTGAAERAAGAAGTAMRGGGPNQPLAELHVTSVRVLNQACTPPRQ